MHTSKIMMDTNNGEQMYLKDHFDMFGSLAMSEKSRASFLGCICNGTDGSEVGGGFGVNLIR
jgi:hypothetical protein